MKDWQKAHIEPLKTAIINEFTFLFNYFEKKSDVIYAVALILDSDAITAYMAGSSLKSLEDKHKGKKWEETEWVYGVETDNNVKNDMESFCKLTIKHYDEDIIPQYQTPNFDFEEEVKNNIQMFSEAMKQAKQKVVELFKLNEQELVFYITIPGENELTINSAKIINENSDLLTNLIDSKT